jgi:hypothetical protein
MVLSLSFFSERLRLDTATLVPVCALRVVPSMGMTRKVRSESVEFAAPLAPHLMPRADLSASCNSGCEQDQTCR